VSLVFYLLQTFLSRPKLEIVEESSTPVLPQGRKITLGPGQAGSGDGNTSKIMLSRDPSHRNADKALVFQHRQSGYFAVLTVSGKCGKLVEETLYQCSFPPQGYTLSKGVRSGDELSRISEERNSEAKSVCA
jgi:hypothetical protein